MKKRSKLFLIINFIVAYSLKLYASDILEEVQKDVKNMKLTSIAESSETLPSNDFIFSLICKHFGRHEVVSMQQVNRKFQNLINNNKIWQKYYGDALYLDNTDSSKDYKALVKEYYKPYIRWIDTNKMLQDLSVKNNQKFEWFMPENFNDKNIIVGSVKIGHTSIAAKIENNEHIEVLGLLNNGRWSRALNTNSDGSIIVGFAADSNNKQNPTAFKYTKNEGLKSLGLLNNGNSSRAISTNADGSEILGFANDGNDQNRPKVVKWMDNNIEILDSLSNENLSVQKDLLKDQNLSITPKIFRFSNANSDRSRPILVGHLINSDENKTEIAFKHEKNSIYPFNPLRDGKLTDAHSTNFDGSIIGGEAADQKKNEPRVAVLWNKQGDIYSIDSYFKALNLPLCSKSLTSIKGVSYDGSTFIGETNDHNIFIGHKPRLELFNMHP